MQCILRPSLEHMALVKILATLWNQDDIRALMTKEGFIFSYDRSNQWKKIEYKVTEKVSNLLLPQLLKQKLSDFVKPIGLQILEWMRSHCRVSYFFVDLPAELKWTPLGTVDKKGTAEMLVKDKNIKISMRYKLACIYCLENDIQDLWYNMPEDVKQSFSQDFQSRADWQSVVYFWTHNMKKRGLDYAHISCRSAFQFCAKVGNKAAAEYFLQKLTPTERGESLVETAKFVEDSDVLCFFLSKMNEEQQTEVFKNNPFTVMKCFLNWPLQCLFIEMADRMWGFLSKEHHRYLLKSIINKIVDGYNDWNYKKLFGEFWQKSPNAFKSLNILEFYSHEILLFLVKFKDKENLKLILKDISISEKKNFFYSHFVQRQCFYLVCDEQWDFLEFFIKEFLPSEDDMMKFKEELEEQINEMSIFKNRVTLNLVKNDPDWKQSFCLSDDSALKCDKRSVEEGENSSSKHHHSLQ